MEFRLNNLAQERETARKRYCPQKAKQDRELFKVNNPGKFAQYSAKYYKKNREDILARNRETDRQRRQTDVLYMLKRRLSNIIHVAFKRGNFVKSSKTAEILDCDWDTARKHIEDQFQEGMSWDNYGIKWHIDHIKPLAAASDAEELTALNHYTNLQPLWIADNLKKSSHYENTFYRRSSLEDKQNSRI
jgi:hypothetical protein